MNIKEEPDDSNYVKGRQKYRKGIKGTSTPFMNGQYTDYKAYKRQRETEKMVMVKNVLEQKLDELNKEVHIQNKLLQQLNSHIRSLVQIFKEK